MQRQGMGVLSARRSNVVGRLGHSHSLFFKRGLQISHCEDEALVLGRGAAARRQTSLARGCSGTSMQ
jgi:hypothetical protein